MEKIIVNQLDREINNLLQSDADQETILKQYTVILTALRDELKDSFRNGKSKDIISGLIDDCLYYATRDMEELHENPDWDEDTAEDLFFLLRVAGETPEFIKARSWANSKYHEDFSIKLLVLKEEAERQMAYLHVTEIESLYTLSYRILTWLNVRNSIIQAYRNR